MPARKHDQWQGVAAPADTHSASANLNPRPPRSMEPWIYKSRLPPRTEPVWLSRSFSLASTRWKHGIAMSNWLADLPQQG
jgi:hypothetical protein